MALASYVRGGAKAVKKGISTVGSYMLKPVDALIEKNKAVEAARRERDRKMIIQNFGSEANYNKQREETERLIMKKRLEEKEKGTATSTRSYVKKR